MAKMTPRTLSGFYGTAARTTAADGADHGDPPPYLFPLWLYPLDTPVIESSEVLLAKGGGETEKQIYRFQKGDADLALRFDLTVPWQSMWPSTTTT